jgi:hypothetical protein
MDLKKINAWGAVVVLLLMLVWIGYDFANLTRLSMNHRFTIGTVTKKVKTGKGPFFHYQFWVSGKSFEGGAPPDENPMAVEGSRYYVKFLPNDPTISSILWELPVPVNVQQAPEQGWERLPE